MATLLDAPKANPNQISDFVEKQLNAARRRVRTLDFFLAGLSLALVSLAFLLVVLLIDRYVATPKGSGWAALAVYLGLAAYFIYLRLFQSSRRQINPYFAARQVEQTVPNAKNSLVTWVDFEDDARLAGSIKSAISQKAAKDLKGVDLNRAIENRGILWIGIAAVVLLLANVIVAFLPPTRSELTLEEPKSGDISVFNNQEVSFQIRVNGRIPGPNAPDTVRLRMWYNPDDPETYEERPMKLVEGERRKFELTIPPKQVRNGFQYRILAGDARTKDYTVTCKIVPEFSGFEVSYDYPLYLKRPSQTTNDANLLAPFSTIATLTASTNREVTSGFIEIEGQARTIEGTLIEGRPTAVQFRVPMEKEGAFRVWFVTPEGDKNQDAARWRLGVIDPKPVVRQFDISYEYPAYLRFKPMSAKDVREPEIEAPRGTKIVLTAKTTRGMKDARFELPGQPAIVGELVTDEPMWARFALPPLDKDGTARITFTPTTTEAPSAPRSIVVRSLVDQLPQVQIDEPKEDEVRVAANGSVVVQGLATDDHGVNKMTLFLRVKGAAEDRYLQPKPYRGGMSFLRKEDNSWPTKVEYKDVIKLPELRLAKDPNWRVTPGIEIEYWLEAEDNCAVPEPNRLHGGVSKTKKIVVIAPVMKPEEQKKIEQENQKLDQDQKAHEKKQDAANANDKRDVQQPPPKGAENQPAKEEGNPEGGKDGQPKEGPPPPGTPDPKPGDPKDGGMNPGKRTEGGTPDHENRTEQVERALDKAEKSKDPGVDKPDSRPMPDAKVDPSEKRPEPKGGPPPAEDRKPKTDPNMDMSGETGAGAPKPGNIDNKTKEDKAEAKPQGEMKPGMVPEKGEEKPSFGGASDGAGEKKPEPKEAPMPKPGMAPEKPADKSEARKEPGKDKEPAGAKGENQSEPAEGKPEKEVTSADKKPGGEQGPMGKTNPQETASDKPRETPPAGETRPQPKKDEVADAGKGRNGPKEMDEAGSNRESKPPMPGANEQAKADNKPGPGSPPPKDGEQGELDRELGELDREINSTKPKIDPRKQSSVDQLMRNPETREKTREKLDEIEKNAKDPLTREKAQQARKSGEQAAKNYDQEKPNKENVDELAKKLNSKDEKERKEAENRIKDWEKDQQAREDLKKETDELKKKDRSKGEKVEEAMKKSEQARNQPKKGEAPKLDEKQLADMAKDLNSKDEQTKANAEKKLDQMMTDPKTREQAKEKLQQMADKAQGQDKKDLENAAKEAGKKADQLAAKDPQPKDKSGQKLDPKALEDAAKKLASSDEKTKQEAKDQLKEMMKDPKAAKEAEKQLKEMAQNAKTPEEKKALDDAAKQAGDVAKELAKKDPKSAAGGVANKDAPKPDPKELKDLAKQMAGNDDKAKEEAKKKMEDMLKDPKTAEEAKKMLDDMAKNDKNTPAEKKALEDAAKKAGEMAKKDGPKTDDLKDLAKEFEKLDPEAKEKMKKDFEDAMKDPKKREEMKQKADEMAKNATPEQKKQFDDMMRQMPGGEELYESKPDPADPRNKLKAAELMLDKFKKNVTNDEFGKNLKWTEEQKAKWIKDQEATIEALRRQSEKGDWRVGSGGRSPVSGGPAPIKLDPKAGPDALRGGTFAPPAGYVDPYKKFTGGGASVPKK